LTGDITTRSEFALTYKGGTYPVWVMRHYLKFASVKFVAE